MKTHILKTTVVLVPLTLGLATFSQTATAQTTGADTPSGASSTAPSSSSDTTSGANASGSMSSSAAMGGESNSIDHEDRAFCEKLAMSSTNEVALSQLADGHAGSGDVKQFAQMMVSDHEKLNSELSDLAQRKGVDISSAVQKGQKKGVSRLEKDNGADFDKAYIKQMISGHKSTVELLQKEIKDTKDQDLAALANKALPIVQGHLQKAEDIQKGLQ